MPEIPRDFYRLLLTLESLAEPERPNQETTDQLNVFVQELLSDHSHLLIREREPPKPRDRRSKQAIFTVVGNFSVLGVFHLLRIAFAVDSARALHRHPLQCFGAYAPSGLLSLRG